jgi:two-component system, OmpR family, sensor histidine kinase BaeS
MRRAAMALALFFLLTFTVSAAAVALVFRAFHLTARPRVAALVTVVGIILLVALGNLGVRAFRRTAAPIAEVMEAARRLEAGNYGVRVQVRGTPDVRRLAGAFNSMAERLESNERRRRDLLADLAHELRQPLMVIQGLAEGILDGLYEPDPARLSTILEQTRVTTRLLEDLQTLSKAEAGVLHLHRERIGPQSLVAEAVDSFKAQAAASGISLVAQVADALPPVDVDRVRIGEVLSNLVMNALRFTPSGGTVTVGAERAGADVSFWVADSGIGIPEAQLPSIFDRFAKSKDSSGTGLGLAIAKGLVQAHGGTISVQSRSGEGTAMRFVLPTESEV